MRRFVQSLAINTLAVLVAGYVIKGIHYEKPLDLLVAALLLGVFNSVLRPILMLLTFPLVLFTLGLFRLVINGVLLFAVGALLQPHFRVDGFWDAFWGALIISFISSVLHFLTGTGKARVRVDRRQPSRGSGPPGRGPVIDI